MQTEILWQADVNTQANSRLTHFIQWLNAHEYTDATDYDAVWQWSTDNIEKFWEAIWLYFEVKSHSPYTRILSGTMPKAQWFEGATLNYVEHIFRQKNSAPALKFASETTPLSTISWESLENEVACVAAFLRKNGVTKGDRVVAYLPNIPEAIVAFLATASIGAVWSSCSPDFGVGSVVDRFKQIEPKVIFTVNGYTYNEKPFDRTVEARDIVAALPTLENVVLIPYLKNKDIQNIGFEYVIWENLLSDFSKNTPPLSIEPVPFGHPLYILYSSGTTGIPKAITHCHGGILLEHLKYLAFHNDLKAGETFFWYATTGWMMWNFAVSALLHGVTVFIFDGSPTKPDLSVLWHWADTLPIHHFGTSAPFLAACMKAEISPRKLFSLNHLRSIGSTGSPLPPEAFKYVYEHIKPDVWLSSMSGGTDVCTAWVGGNILKPVEIGNIQTRCLGCAMHSFDERGNIIIGEVGEMVVTKPMPSMPIFFWNDSDFSKYTASYFEMYAGIWRHGDWLKINENGSLSILGRSDATLNRDGIRIGTAEIYNVLDSIPSLRDSLILNLELAGGKHFMPLFVMLQEGVSLTGALKKDIGDALRKAYSPRHVPDEIIAVADIPYTISGKKMEAPVKKILMGLPLEKAVNLGATRNPEALDFFINFAKQFEGKTGF